MDKFITAEIPKSWKNVSNDITVNSVIKELIENEEIIDSNDEIIFTGENSLNEMILKQLKEFKFPLNRSRENVMNYPKEDIHGFCLGLVWKHNGGHRLETCSKLQKWKKYQKIWETTNLYMNHFKPDSKYTSVQYNKNIKCAKHKDGNNVGNSLIIAFGDYTGGRLMIYDENDNIQYIDIRNKFYEFDGSKIYHQTEEFTGDRFCLVFFRLEDNRKKINKNV